MRIVFVASSVAAGLDGVGDYVHRLARELENQGHAVLAIGINDFHPGSVAFSNPGAENLLAHQPWPERRRAIAERLRHFRPEALSMQFTYRGFQAGKNDASIASDLALTMADGARHIMYHETWEESDFGNRHPRFIRAPGIGFCMARFHHLWRPNRISFTNTTHFKRQLNRIGIDAAVRAIPATIPVVPLTAQGEREIWTQMQMAGAGELPRGETGVLVFFGRIVPEWEAEQAMVWLSRAWKNSGKKWGLILSVGNAGYDDIGWRRLQTAAQAAGFRTAKMGLRSEAEVSGVLQQSDLGVITTPVPLLGKSSSYAAMLAHGLPVFALDAGGGGGEGEACGKLIGPGGDFYRDVSELKRIESAVRRWETLARAYVDALGETEGAATV